MANGTQTQSAKLKTAGEKAEQAGSKSYNADGKESCASIYSEKVTIKLLGSEKAVIRYQKCTIRDSKGETHNKETNPDGIVVFDHLPEGNCFLDLDGLDRSAWGNTEKEHDDERDGATPRTHTVVQGEDIDSIAYEYGFHPNTIWNHKANGALRKKRENPSVLKEEDKVKIPELESRKEKLHTGKSYTFYRKGVPAAFKVKFTDDDGPRAKVSYIFKIVTRSGPKIQDVTAKTDKDGLLIEAIPPNTTEGEIVLNPGDDEESIPFRLGYINPVDDGYQGVQSMLNNLGYYCGDEDDVLGELTIAAVREFQEKHMKLEDKELLSENVTEIDGKTLEAIQKTYSE